MIFILFLTGTLIINVLGWQVTPFFVWGMYSEKEDTSNIHSVLKITVNDSIVINYTDYTDANKFFLTSPVQLYTSIKKNGEDPTKTFLKTKLGNNYSTIRNPADKVLNGQKEYDLFLPWYKRYLEQTTGITINRYTIELLNVGYTGENKIKVYSTELIDRWKQ